MIHILYIYNYIYIYDSYNSYKHDSYYDPIHRKDTCLDLFSLFSPLGPLGRLVLSSIHHFAVKNALEQDSPGTFNSSRRTWLRQDQHRSSTNKKQT